jgi:hypothetical protein
MNGFHPTMNGSGPFLPYLVPVDSLIATFVVLAYSAVSAILNLVGYAKIFICVVESVAIFVVADSGISGF